MSLYREKQVKHTRSPHICHGCGSNIQHGSPALYIVSKSEDIGILFTGYLCQTCERIFNNCDVLNKELAGGFGEEDIKDFCEGCAKWNTCKIKEEPK